MTLYVVQGWYTRENGWEDLTASDEKSEAYQDLLDYDVNEPEYGHRIDTREE